MWLSPTPDLPSKGWDAASPRIVTVGGFQHVETRQRFLVLNTHLDDQGSRARLEAAKLIADLLKLFSKETGQAKVPAILAGDFNSEPSGEAYQYLTTQASFKDTVDSSAARQYGNKITYTGFSPGKDIQSRIDFIFVNVKDPDKVQIDVVNHAVLANQFDDGVFNSDHRAVVADLSFVLKQGNA